MEWNGGQTINGMDGMEWEWKASPSFIDVKPIRADSPTVLPRPFILIVRDTKSSTNSNG